MCSHEVDQEKHSQIHILKLAYLFFKWRNCKVQDSYSAHVSAHEVDQEEHHQIYAIKPFALSLNKDKIARCTRILFLTRVLPRSGSRNTSQIWLIKLVYLLPFPWYNDKIMSCKNLIFHMKITGNTCWNCKQGDGNASCPIYCRSLCSILLEHICKQSLPHVY